MKAAPSKYTRTAVWLHWIAAVLVVCLLALGLYMVTVPRNTPARGTLYNLHKSLGISLFGIIVVRLIWRLMNRPPALPPGLPVWQRRAARLVHALFYCVLLIQPLTGYATSVFGKFGVRFFGIALPKLVGENEPIRSDFVIAHSIGAACLGTLIALHLFAALRHRRRNPLLWRRMLSAS